SETVKQFIIDNFLFGDGAKLSVDTPLFEKGIIDSTGVLELVAFIEDNFNVTVTDDELVQDNFSSLLAIEKFLQSKNNKSAAN
ncbi:MAG: acyl carrier protein, partial [Ignavibacteria bacterium]|nr:acyl carrier protein [Ignavibacteria bacterium]